MSNPRVPFQLESERPALSPPKGKPLIVHVVVNIEHWPFDKPMPRSLIQKPHGQSRGPDVSNFCWVEYGLRCGLPRLVRILAERQLPASAPMNASVIDVYPACAEAVLQAGWEVIGHALVQRSLEHEDDEVAVIGASLEKLGNFTGTRTRGWLGPGFGERWKRPITWRRRASSSSSSGAWTTCLAGCVPAMGRFLPCPTRSNSMT